MKTPLAALVLTLVAAAPVLAQPAADRFKVVAEKALAAGWARTGAAATRVRTRAARGVFIGQCPPLWAGH